MIAGFPICNILNLSILFNDYLLYSNMKHNINGNPTAVQKEKNDDLCNLHSCRSGRWYPHRNGRTDCRNGTDSHSLRSLWLGGNDRLTDLTCLLSLEDLESVGVDGSMKKAIASLEGQNYRFRLEING